MSHFAAFPRSWCRVRNVHPSPALDDAGDAPMRVRKYRVTLTERIALPDRVPIHEPTDGGSSHGGVAAIDKYVRAGHETGLVGK